MTTESTETVVALPDDVRASLAAVPAPAAHKPAPAERPDIVKATGEQPATKDALVRVPLGDGDWADIRDPKTVRVHHRDEVTRSLRDDSTLGGVMVDMSKAILAVAILDWSLELDLPSKDIRVLSTLTLDQEDALLASPVVARLTELLGNVGRAAASPSEPSSDPNSPTAPSAA